jgi:osmotically-inducible protein OsmY
VNLHRFKPAVAHAAAVLALAGTAATLLGACAPLIVGGAVIGGGLMATDRRTTGTQVEDEGIEFRAGARVRELATLGQVSITSYNRTVLITGEVPGEAERAAVEQAVAKVENVRSVVNELVVAANSPIGSRSKDAILAAKVKATLVDAKDVHANAYKVVAERGVVYLMGRVTEREAARGAELASSVSGVSKVVRVFELMTEQELAALGRAAAGPGAPAPAPISTATGTTPGK